MIQIWLQIAVVLALSGLAIRIQLSLRRRGEKDWHSILKGFHDGHGRLSELSQKVKRGEAGCSDSEVWLRLRGIAGLWTIYKNTEVLLEALEFVETQCRHGSDVYGRTRQIRSNTMKTQMQIVKLALTRAVTFIGTPRSAVIEETITTYLASINNFGIVLSDFCPHLIRSYRFFVTREQYSNISHQETPSDFHRESRPYF